MKGFSEDAARELIGRQVKKRLLSPTQPEG
jgi:hypothetical protein